MFPSFFYFDYKSERAGLQENVCLFWFLIRMRNTVDDWTEFESERWIMGTEGEI